MEKRLRLLLVAAIANGLLALTALGLIVWMNVDPVYWFPKLAAEQGQRGPTGERGARGPLGPTGPPGVSGDVEIDSRVSDLESTLANNDLDDISSSIDDADSRISTLESELESAASDSVDLPDRLDTLESSLSSVCGVLDYAEDANLNGAC